MRSITLQHLNVERLRELEESGFEADCVAEKVLVVDWKHKKLFGVNLTNVSERCGSFGRDEVIGGKKRRCFLKQNEGDFGEAVLELGLQLLHHRRALKLLLRPLWILPFQIHTDDYQRWKDVEVFQNPIFLQNVLRVVPLEALSLRLLRRALVVEWNDFILDCRPTTNEFCE